MDADMQFSVSDFVAVFNQTINYAYPTVTIVGELSQFRVSKNRWVYFDLKDETASVKFFGTIYQLSGPLEDGMVLTVRGVPQLHPQYGFSITVQSIQLTGEGTIKKAAQLLQVKLDKEGLFDDSRKRVLPYPPKTIGLIASRESAAYADFVKVLNARWGGVHIYHCDVQVQGEAAPAQIVQAIEYLNSHSTPLDVLVVTRGGGSAEDMAAFSTEQVTRAVAASRIPTLVAIGHEIDISLAELAADRRASTPSNAAELLTPDRRAVLANLDVLRNQLTKDSAQMIDQTRQELQAAQQDINRIVGDRFEASRLELLHLRQLLNLAHPRQLLARGYALLRSNGQLIKSVKSLKSGDLLDIELHDGQLKTTVNKVQ